MRVWFLPGALETISGEFEIEMVGVCLRVTLVDGCLWDADASRMRG